MLKSVLRDRLLVIMLVLAVLIRILSTQETWVERYYTHGFYPAWASFLRTILGWIPFSIGDLLYLGAFLYIVIKTWKFLRILAKRKVKEYLSWILVKKLLKLVLGIYLAFNLGWGLNYNRTGIAGQLELQVQKYTRTELAELATALHHKLNAQALEADSIRRLQWKHTSVLFRQGVEDYNRIRKKYPFLDYERPSIKSSLYSFAGHYFGFSGYFNPFTGEAQMNMAEPVFILPFVLNHEIAHQLGYGKENEASFVSFLVSRESTSTDFRYSIYYELFYNALRELRINGDSVTYKKLVDELHPRVRTDRRDEIAFRTRRKNKMQPLVSGFYDQYLRFNNQPGGLATYNEVTAWLIAYMKKFGAEAL